MSNLLNEKSGIIALLAGNGVDVKGAYVQLFASTVRLSRWLTVMFAPVNGVDTVTGDKIIYDIATGAGGSEVDTICNLGQGQTTTTVTNVGCYWQLISIPWQFASGLRLSCRCADEQPAVSTHSYHVQVRLFEQPIP